MIKKLLSLIVLLMSCMTMAAQLDLKGKLTSSFNVIPSIVSSDGKISLEVSTNWDGDSYYNCPDVINFDMYNDDIEKVKSINVAVEKKMVTTITYTSNINETSTDEDNWTINSIDTTYQNVAPRGIQGKTNFDAEPHFMSQTLFNTDDKYEYIVLDYAPYTYEKYYDSDHVKKVYNTYYVNGFKIMSEDGTVLSTTAFENVNKGESHHAYFYYTNLNGKLYFITRVDDYYDNNGESYSMYYFYKIDRGSSSIKQVASPIKVKVSPTIADRYEPINVELEGDNSTNRAVSVVDAAGKTVYRTNIVAGQTNVKIDTSRLSQGLNVLTVQGGKDKAENVKIFVK